MPHAYFAFGSTLANMVNFETYFTDDSPHVIGAQRVPALGSVKTRVLDSILVRNGKINSRLLLAAPQDADRVAFNKAAFGDQTTESIELYVSALDDTDFYSPYLCVMDRPVEPEDYQIAAGGGYDHGLVLALWNLRVQVATKTNDYTVTTSDRYLKASTGSGSITFTLPAVAGVTTNTIYSFHKISASNNMVLDPNGAEKIDGASTKTVTANGARLDIFTDGVAWYTVNSGTVLV